MSNLPAVPTEDRQRENEELAAAVARAVWREAPSRGFWIRAGFWASWGYLFFLIDLALVALAVVLLLLGFGLVTAPSK